MKAPNYSRAIENEIHLRIDALAQVMKQRGFEVQKKRAGLRVWNDENVRNVGMSAEKVQGEFFEGGIRHLRVTRDPAVLNCADYLQAELIGTKPFTQIEKELEEASHDEETPAGESPEL
ncbi:MAG: hypothetical protein KDN05_06300 [Verrucomicrobiae bacterium]|nr:hypothetical protein [Verrucomicrobiae bacterium]